MANCKTGDLAIFAGRPGMDPTFEVNIGKLFRILELHQVTSDGRTVWRVQPVGKALSYNTVRDRLMLNSVPGTCGDSFLRPIRPGDLESGIPADNKLPAEVPA